MSFHCLFASSADSLGGSAANAASGETVPARPTPRTRHGSPPRIRITLILLRRASDTASVSFRICSNLSCGSGVNGSSGSSLAPSNTSLHAGTCGVNSPEPPDTSTCTLLHFLLERTSRPGPASRPNALVHDVDAFLFPSDGQLAKWTQTLLVRSSRRVDSTVRGGGGEDTDIGSLRRKYS